MAFQLDLLGSLTWYSLTRSSKTRSSRTWSSQTRIHGLSDDVFVDSVITDLVFTDLAVEGKISLYTPAIEITNPKVSIKPKCIFFLQNLEIGSRDNSNEQITWMSSSNTRRFNVVRKEYACCCYKILQKQLYVITVNVISVLNVMRFHWPYLLWASKCKIAYCYQSVDVIKNMTWSH